MQRNGVISLRPAPGTWQRILGAMRTDAEAAYGCVDWYLYRPRVAGAAHPCAAAAHSSAAGSNTPAAADGRK
jgi:hypothetical protein